MLMIPKYIIFVILYVMNVISNREITLIKIFIEKVDLLVQTSKLTIYQFDTPTLLYKSFTIACYA